MIVDTADARREIGENILEFYNEVHCIKLYVDLGRSPVTDYGFQRESHSFSFYVFCLVEKLEMIGKLIGKTWLGGNCGRIWDRRRGVD